MVKNFFEYIKELIPEKGEVFFTYENHSSNNGISLYSLADLICGKKIKFAEEVTAYSWNVREMWGYTFPTMGLMFFYKDGSERWIHFSKNAFYGAVCIVAIRNNITFDDDEHENLRQIWARKLENKETEKDKKITNLEDKESNFDDVCFVKKISDEVLRKHRTLRGVRPKDVFYHIAEEEIIYDGERYVYDFDIGQYVLAKKNDEEFLEEDEYNESTADTF